MPQRNIFIEISGGCFQNAVGVPKGHKIELIDWDNLLGDGADTAHEWSRLDDETRTFIRREYPSDYRRVLSRLSEQQE